MEEYGSINLDEESGRPRASRWQRVKEVWCSKKGLALTAVVTVVSVVNLVSLLKGGGTGGGSDCSTGDLPTCDFEAGDCPPTFEPCPELVHAVSGAAMAVVGAVRVPLAEFFNRSLLGQVAYGQQYCAVVAERDVGRSWALEAYGQFSQRSDMEQFVRGVPTASVDPAEDVLGGHQLCQYRECGKEPNKNHLIGVGIGQEDLAEVRENGTLHGAPCGRFGA